jgi:hypothetical protein
MPARSGFGHWVTLFFRHGSNAALAASTLALLGALVAWQALVPMLGWLLLGVAMFPFYEYLIHRFVLHAPPSRHGWVYQLQRQVHYDHHEDTSRIDRIFTPLWAFFPLLTLQAALYLALGASLPVAAAILAGNLGGYLYYEWVHFVAHVPITPRTRWGQAMKKYHLWHHHKNEHYWYGVTSPLVDVLTGKRPPVETIAQSPSARRLHGPHA